MDKSTLTESFWTFTPNGLTTEQIPFLCRSNPISPQEFQLNMSLPSLLWPTPLMEVSRFWKASALTKDTGVPIVCI